MIDSRVFEGRRTQRFQVLINGRNNFIIYSFGSGRLGIRISKQKLQVRGGALVSQSYL